MRFRLGWGPARCCRYRSSAWRGETPLNRKICFETEKKYGLAVSHVKNDGVEEDGLAINVSGVFLDFKTPSTTKQVLQGVNLGIPRGRFHMLLGPNGCGKSTLLRILAGLLKADSGSFSVTPPYGFVFQNPDHQVVMPTVSADVAFGLGRYNLEEGVVRAAVAHALRQVGLADLAERPVSSLSGGQKQRVAIAGALAESPQVLLMDELTTFLDYEDQLNVLRCVRSIVDGEAFREPSPGTPSVSTSGGGSGSGVGDNGQEYQRRGGARAMGPAGGSGGTPCGGSGAASTGGVTALWVTHRLEELEYADYVSYMDGGRIVFSGTPAEMRSFLRSLGAVL